MSSIVPISIDEFSFAFNQAKIEHENSSEPIPEMSEESFSKMQYILELPFSNYFGRVVYWGFYRKASILFYTCIKNHPLGNGNKRMACILLGLFYVKNNRTFNFSQKELYDLAYFVVKSDASKYDDTLYKLINILKHHG